MNVNGNDQGLDQARIDKEAADWLVRRSDGPRPADEREAFEAWRTSDPRRDRTFSALKRTWAEAAELKHLAGLALPRAESESGRARFLALWRRPALSVAAVIAIAVVAAIFFIAPQGQRLIGGRHPTDLAEARTLHLPDGSTVVVAAQSKIIMKFTGAERRVQLAAGEALFEVKRDPARPFVVDAGETVIRDVGTRFDVDRSSASVRIAVIEGEVEVRASRPSLAIDSVHVLKAGDGIEAIWKPAQDALHPATLLINPVAVVAPAAWRDGRLVYENTRLADIVADIDRYYPPGIEVSAGAQDLRVTASFRTNQVSAFLTTLSSALPVVVASDSDGRFRVNLR